MLVYLPIIHCLRSFIKSSTTRGSKVEKLVWKMAGKRVCMLLSAVEMYAATSVAMTTSASANAASRAVPGAVSSSQSPWSTSSGPVPRSFVDVKDSK